MPFRLFPNAGLVAKGELAPLFAVPFTRNPSAALLLKSSLPEVLSFAAALAFDCLAASELEAFTSAR